MMVEQLQFEWDASLAEAAGLVAERNLPPTFLDDAPAEDIVSELQKLSHVRLDREQLTILQPSIFYILSNLTNLYLQENGLTNLKALENAKKLKFLTVANNRITNLEGLSSLLQLILFDASNNSINHINVDSELPTSLSFLNITNNPCCWNQEGLFSKLKSFLPNLKDFDWKEM
ncbi:hypothetical protein M758_12G034300 [Ceratodon purpureus]|nr:hypothetical protein M758_12G034300 [Ceratodon purpureus]